MEAWRKVWREGFAPFLPIKGLKALADALRSDDPDLVQWAATQPGTGHWPVTKACAIAYCGWKDGILEVDRLVDFFAKACSAADQAINQRNYYAEFLNWFDKTPRQEMIRELLPEVEMVIEARA